MIVMNHFVVNILQWGNSKKLVTYIPILTYAEESVWWTNEEE